MSPDLIVELLREGMLLAVVVALPPLLAAWGVGVLVALLQSLTGVTDPVIGLVPRMGAAVVALLLAGPWMLEQAVAFGGHLLDALVAVQV